ncbi:MAG: Type transport protein GspH [Pseudomonadota bacterium]|jgi:prepilin-type N-terminal cleavage/methylation domain-containing protein
MNPERVHVRPAPSAGFTIIELMVTVAVVGLVTAFAAPAMLDTVRARRLDTMAQQVDAAIRLARAEAIKRATVVVVKSAPDNTWSQMHLYVAPGRNPANLPDYAATPSPVLRWYLALPKDIAASSAAPDRLAFDALGRNVALDTTGLPIDSSIVLSAGSQSRTVAIARSGTVTITRP